MCGLWDIIRKGRAKVDRSHLDISPSSFTWEASSSFTWEASSRSLALLQAACCQWSWWGFFKEGFELLRNFCIVGAAVSDTGTTSYLYVKFINYNPSQPLFPLVKLQAHAPWQHPHTHTHTPLYEKRPSLLNVWGFEGVHVQQLHSLHWNIELLTLRYLHPTGRQWQASQQDSYSANTTWGKPCKVGFDMETKGIKLGCDII